MKLSKVQQEVVDALKSGWTLGKSTSFAGHVWLQKGILGCGGETKRVHLNTFYALLKKDLIVQAEYSFPTSEYRLVEKSS